MWPRARHLPPHLSLHSRRIPATEVRSAPGVHIPIFACLSVDICVNTTERALSSGTLLPLFGLHSYSRFPASSPVYSAVRDMVSFPSTEPGGWSVSSVQLPSELLTGPPIASLPGSICIYPASLSQRQRLEPHFRLEAQGFLICSSCLEWGSSLTPL